MAPAVAPAAKAQGRGKRRRRGMRARDGYRKWYPARSSSGAGAWALQVQEQWYRSLEAGAGMERGSAGSRGRHWNRHGRAAAQVAAPEAAALGSGTGSGAPGGQSPYSGAKPGSGVIQRGAGAGPPGSGGPRRGGPGGLGPGGSGGIRIGQRHARTERLQAAAFQAGTRKTKTSWES